MAKEVEIDKEGMDNLVAVFSLLLKWDREQNPHLYTKNKNPTEIIKDNREKLDGDGISTMSENS